MNRSKNPRLDQPAGFALVVTVSMMVLLAILAVGLLSLSSVALRSSASSSAMAEARQNARMALMLAIGELQRHAGKDQVITAESDVVIQSPQSASSTGEYNGKQLRWTGVWDSAAANQTNQLATAGQPLKWLVSGANGGTAPDPGNVTTQDTFLIAGDQPGSNSTGVRVPLTPISAKGTTSPGRCAYWVSDLGVKAKVNIPTPPETSAKAAKVASTQLAGESQLAKIETSWEDVSDEQKRKWLSMETGRLVATGGAGNDLTRKYQHDLTCDGYGLPVDVSRGGFKKDLTTIFDDTSLCDKYLGGKPSGSNTMTVSTPESFYLLDAYSGSKVGPNWGNLYHYYKQYRLTSSTAIIPPDSTGYGIDIRSNDWEPYNNVSRKFGPDTYTDVQHLNSPMTPVAALLRMNFRLGAKEITDPSDKTKKVYQLRLHVKPIVALWNPYNFRLQTSGDVDFAWATFPYLKLQIKDSKGTRTQNVWLREIAKNSGKATNPPRYYSDLIIPSSIGKLEPGETKIYSVNSSNSLGATNTLDDKTLNYRADFYADLVDGITKKPVTAAEKSATVKIVEMYLDDMQTPATQARWNTLDPDTDSGSYLAVKHSTINLSRYTGLWAPRQVGNRRTPGDVDVGSLPPLQVSTLISNNVDPLVAWEIRTRTADNDIDPARMYV